MSLSYEHIDQLICKFFSNEASESDKKELLDWVEASAENKKYFLQQKRILLSLEASYSHINTKKAYSQTKAKIKKPAKTRTLYFRIVAVAASVILAFGLWQYFGSDTNTVSEPAPAHSITYSSTNSVQSVILPDSSSVCLNNNSKLELTDFSGSKRGVTLTGTAFFDVSHDADRPFIITTGFIQVEVLGTAFEITPDSTNTEIRVSVTRGKVKVTNIKSGENIILTPNEFCIAEIDKALVKESFENENFLVWKTGLLNFQSTPLGEAVPQISNLYGKKIVFASDDLKQIPLTAKLSDTSFSNFKTLLELACNIEVVETDTLIFLKPGE